MRIAFLTPVPVQVRFQRRIRALEAREVEAVLLSFERDYYEGLPPPVPYTSLGRISHGSYRDRLGPLLRAVGPVRRALSAADAVYAFGLDMFALAVAATTGTGVRPIVYEVGDIRDVMVRPGAVPMLLRRLERALVRRASLVVTTSPAYLREYFVGRLGLPADLVHVVENKVDGGDLRKAMEGEVARIASRKRDSLRIGYFGLLRCESSLRILMTAARTGEGRIEVLARGLPLVKPLLMEKFAATPHITFGGSFRSPQDLPDMYGSVDAVWVGYSGPLELPNWRWARSNRYYEAAFFEKPMIGAVGTEDGRLIAEQDLGPCLDLGQPERSTEALRSIQPRQVDAWRENVRRLPRECYEFDGEHDAILRAVSRKLR